MHSDRESGMSKPARAFSDLTGGLDLGSLVLTISPAANERYWRAAGADHRALRSGTLYPPIAANLTVLLFGQVCSDAVIQTRQHLRCHRAVAAGTTLSTRGRVIDCYEKRGRAYVDVEAVVATVDEPGAPVWTSTVAFTPAATFGAQR